MSINLKATDARVNLKAQGSSFELKGSLGNTKSFTPLVHYKMNDNAASTVVVDSGSGSNNGTTTNNTSTMSVTGKINQALDFNGAESLDVTDTVTNFDNTDDYSISVWIKSSTKSDQSISEHWGGQLGGYPWAIRGPSATTGKIYFAVWDTSYNPRVTSTSDLSDGVWHHVIATKKSSTKELKLYIDGALDAELTHTTLNSTKSTNEGFAIGARTSAVDYPFTGSIDDFRIYDRTLTRDEVEELYNGGDGTEENNISRIRVPLKAQTSSFNLKGSLGNTKLFSPTNHWKMNETTGTTAADSVGGNTGTMAIDTSIVAYYPFNGNANDESSNSNNGTVTGATLTTDRFSVSNKAYTFDGDDDIDCGFTLPDYAKCTIAFWFKTAGTGGSQRPITTKQTYGGDRLMLFQMDSTGVLRFSLFDDTPGEARVTSTIAYDDDAWHFAVGTYDGTNIKIYVDDDAVVTAAKTFSGALTGLDDITISGYSSERWVGEIDEVMIMNVALNANEVSDLYDLTNVRDLNTSPFVTGKINNGIELDGLNLLNLDSSITLDIDNTSVCFWANITTKLKSEGFVVLSNTAGASWTQMITLYAGGGNMFYMEPTTNNVQVTWPEPSSLSGWHHFIFTMSTGGVPNLYVDGVDQGAPNSVAKTVAESFPILSIGGGNAHISSHYGRFTNLKLDDVRIYNRALKLDEAEELYNAGSGTEGDNISRIRITLKGGEQ